MRLVASGGEWDEARFDEMVARIERGLGDLGLHSGHHVGLLTGRTPVAVAAFAACRRLRLVAVPLATDLPLAALAGQIRHAQVDALLAARGWADAAREAAEATGTTCIVASEDATDLDRVRTVRVGEAQPGHGEIAVILHTSGTTRQPRAWAHTRRAVDLHAGIAAERIGLREDSVVLAPLPLHHVGGFALVQRALRLGHQVVLPARFDAAGLYGLMERHDVTHVSLVPVMLARLLDAGARAPRSLRSVLIGGDRLPAALARRAIDAGWPLQPSYGLTEAGSQVATALVEEAQADPGTVGKPLTGITVEVHDDSGRDVPPGVSGTIVVRGETLGFLYTPGALVPQGSVGPLVTEDIGHLDAAGCLHVSGRKIERIVTGGKTVQASDIEAALAACPGVAAVCVSGIPDPVWGQRIVAVVEPGPGVSLEGAAVIGFAEDVLAAHERPREVRVVSRVPRTAAGKLDRAAVQRLWSG